MTSLAISKRRRCFASCVGELCFVTCWRVVFRMDEQQLQAARRLLTEAVSRLDRLTGPASASAPTTSSYAAQGSSATDLRAPDRLPPLPTSLERGSEHTDASSRSRIDTARNERLALFRPGSFLAQNYKLTRVDQLLFLYQCVFLVAGLFCWRAWSRHWWAKSRVLVSSSEGNK